MVISKNASKELDTPSSSPDEAIIVLDDISPPMVYYSNSKNLMLAGHVTAAGRGPRA